MSHHIASREKQAQKIHAILKDYLNTDDFKSLHCLEVGCGTGEISAYFANKVKTIWGIEIDRSIILKHQTSLSANLAYSEADGANLPFGDSSFDLILFPQVYEHTLKQQDLFDEIHRVLKPNGVCFFSGPNRLQIIEPHYFLPFLSWLPHFLSSLYLKITKKGEIFDIYPRNYWHLKKLTKSFSRYDYTQEMIRNPDKFKLNHRMNKFHFCKLPDWLLNLLTPFYPNYNWILIKEYD